LLEDETNAECAYADHWEETVPENARDPVGIDPGFGHEVQEGV
jgi:hypothetical protein